VGASEPSVFGTSEHEQRPSKPTPARDALIGDRYRLELSIGTGGMGCVHLATDTFTGGTVAIKTLRPDLATDLLVRSRLQREASIGARVRSRHVVRLLDHGDDEKAGPYIVFEYLRGESLADVLDRRRSLAPLDAVRIAIDVLEGLAAFHGCGLVHRDVKPENVFLVRERAADGAVRHTARLIDFGLSRAIASTRDGTERVTLEGIVAGTPEYMAPEQISDSPEQDQHVDLYATGVMLYQMLSGKLPFAGDKTDAIFDRVLAGGALPLAEVAPSVDTGVARIVHRAMMKDPAKRYHSAAEMIVALRGWESRQTTSTARENEPTEKLASISVPNGKSAVPKHPRKNRKRPLRAIVTTSGGAAVALVLAVLSLARRGEPPAIAHPSARPVLDARVDPVIAHPTVNGTPTLAAQVPPPPRIAPAPRAAAVAARQRAADVVEDRASREATAVAPVVTRPITPRPVAVVRRAVRLPFRAAPHPAVRANHTVTPPNDAQPAAHAESPSATAPSSIPDNPY
jgi:serine/threonine-protein kinase